MACRIMSRTVAFIQARMSSSRFPGKVVEPLGELPMVIYMAQRARRATALDDVVLVTSTDPSDDTLVEAAACYGQRIFRGSLDDVLARFGSAAESEGADVVVRLTGDCPLIDPDVIDAVVNARERASADYASNIDLPTFPDGLDVECFTHEVLDRANSQARLASQREHVTLWMRSDEAALSRVNVRAVADLSHVRLTVDYPDDLELVRRIVAAQGANEQFDLFDILRTLSAQASLTLLNPHVRNEGLATSIAADRTQPGVTP
jgi:spore coat polysaccharide biosynthesis protein SpsF